MNYQLNYNNHNYMNHNANYGYFPDEPRTELYLICSAIVQQSRAYSTGHTCIVKFPLVEFKYQDFFFFEFLKN